MLGLDSPMLAPMYGKTSCVEKLLQAGANILTFDSLHGRTCLHYAGYYGHLDCLQAILSAAHSTPIADSWGFVRFVNVRDGDGANSSASRRQAEAGGVRPSAVGQRGSRLRIDGQFRVRLPRRALM